eukprot:671163-Amphidinium_carterae.1
MHTQNSRPGRAVRESSASRQQSPHVAGRCSGGCQQRSATPALSHCAPLAHSQRRRKRLSLAMLKTHTHTFTLIDGVSINEWGEWASDSPQSEVASSPLTH